MSDNNDKQRKNSETALVYKWWLSLKDNKGRRAELRRAKNLDEVIFSPAYHSLYKMLRHTAWQSQMSIALMAGMLAHVDHHVGNVPFPHLMARPGKRGSKAAVSGLRFRRLLQNKTPDDLYSSLIRIIRLLDRKADIQDLARSLYWWNDRTRREWAFKYYEKAPSEE